VNQEINENENVILGLNVINNDTQLNLGNNGCIKILKYGLKKGFPCGCKVFQENFCKRHVK
jgi:hypothetical protein